MYECPIFSTKECQVNQICQCLKKDTNISSVCFHRVMKVHELTDVIQWEIYSEMFSKIFIIVNFDVFLFLFEFCDFLSVVQFYRLKLRQLVPIYSILCICYTVMSCSIGKFDFKMFFFSVIFYPGYTFFIQ